MYEVRKRHVMCSFRIDSWEHDCLQVAALELLLFKYNILTHLEIDFVRATISTKDTAISADCLSPEPGCK